MSKTFKKYYTVKPLFLGHPKNQAKLVFEEGGPKTGVPLHGNVKGMISGK